MMMKAVKISSLTPDQHNANRGSERGAYMIEQSLQKLGAGRSIVVDKNGRIIAGNKTAETAEAIGLDDVLVIETDGTKLVAVKRVDLDLDDPQGLARQLAYADNRAGQVSLDFDPDVIMADLEAGLDLGDWWHENELDELIADLQPEPEAGDAEPQISRAEELRELWGVELGQMWRLPSRVDGQEHRLICGDSTDRNDTRYGLKFADVCVTDPPYGTMATGRGGKSIAGDQTYNAVLGLFDILPSVLKDGAAMYIMGGTFNMPMMYKLFDMTFRQVPTVIVWDKCQFVLRHHDYHSQWEAIFYSWMPTTGGANLRWHGDRKQSDVWRFERDAQVDRVHITQKPTAIYEKAITNSCPVRGVVFEPFSGSGAAIVASENLSRQCRAVEISPAYVAVSLQRYQDAFGITPELLTT
jgi:DNA modification methylase